MDRAELDRQYDARGASPDAARSLARRTEAGARARRTLSCRLDVPYGPEPAQRLDIFPATSRGGASGAAGAPLLLYVHGGFWRARSKSDASFLAEYLVPAGIALVAVEHTLAPAADLDTIVAEVRAAVAWTWRHAAGFGADPARLHVGGHSAGAHLAAMLLATDWPSLGLPPDLVRGALLVSGLYDLVPLVDASINETIRLDLAAARRNSPVLHPPSRPMPLVMAVGGAETDEFRRQTADYAAACRGAGVPVALFEPTGRDHYAMSLEPADPASPIACALVSTIIGQEATP